MAMTPEDGPLIEAMAQYLWRQCTDKDDQFGGWETQAEFYRILARGCLANARAHDATALRADVTRLTASLAAAEAEGFARGVEVAAKACDEAVAAMAALGVRSNGRSLVAQYSGDMAADLADTIRALSGPAS